MNTTSKLLTIMGRVAVAAVAVMSLVTLSWSPAQARQAISLNGEWQAVFADAGAIPGPEAAWAPIQVPSLQDSKPQGPHALWYRRKLTLPADWTGRHIVLRFGGIRYSQQVYVNGKEVGRYRGGFEPTEYDLTGKVKLGEDNDLLVAVEDWTSLIAPGAKMGDPQPGMAWGAWVEGGILAPLGYRGSKVGIWEDVSVEARSRVWVEEVFVITSVRQRILSVQVTVKNSGTVKESITVTARVSSGGAGPTMPAQELTMEPGATTVVSFTANWSDPRLWSPQHPHLYSLVAGVRSSTIADSKEVRFGFREFVAQGGSLFLNGVPIKLLATVIYPAQAYPDNPKHAYEIAKTVNCTAIRLGAQPHEQQWYDTADEMGMLLIWESALYSPAATYGGAIPKSEFWDNSRAHLTAQIKLLRNHPSIVIWSGANELLSGAGEAVKSAEEKVGQLADLVRQLDPTRPVMFEGDGDPSGKADIVNLHYPHEFPKWQLYPETAYWLTSPMKLDFYPGVEFMWDHSKPLYLGEFLRIPEPATDAASILFGDAAYPDQKEQLFLAKTNLWQTQIIAARDAGVNGICPRSLWEAGALFNEAFEAHTRAYRPLAAFIKEAGKHAIAGTVIDRTIHVFNDSTRAHYLELRWLLAPENDSWEVGGSQSVYLNPGERQRLPITISLPEIKQAVTPARLALELWEGTERLFSESQDWKIFGREALSGRVPGAPARVAIYDPKGETTRIFSQLGIECYSINAKNLHRKLYWVTTAVMGKGAFETPFGSETSKTLLDFVRAGGTLLIFEQTQYPNWLQLSLSDHDSTISFLRHHDHPALVGLENADLAHWLPDGIVSHREIVKPVWGGFLALIDSGSENGLATAGLAEMRLGKGRLLLCQLDVTGKYGTDPIAAHLFRNLIAYADVPPKALASTGVLCNDTAAAKLDVIGLQYKRLSYPLSRRQLRGLDVLLICNLGQLAKSARWLRQFVEMGGCVILRQVTPETSSDVQKLLGASFELRRNESGAVRLVDRSHPATAISNFELAWFGPSQPEVGRELTSDIADNVLTEPSQVTAPRVVQLKLYTDPGVLSSARFGRGLWIIDQVNWQNSGANEQKASHYLATLLTTLGGEFHLPVKDTAEAVKSD